MSEEELKIYSADEIANHKTSDDLWIAYNGLVYDCSKFLDEHPGGEEVMVDVGGTDATEAFDDIGHSDDAHDIMKGLLIGKLEGGVTKEIKSNLEWEQESSNLPMIAAGVIVVAAVGYFYLNK